MKFFGILLYTIFIITKNAAENSSCGDFYECGNGKCLSTFFICDGEDDCGDNSDEENCSDEYPSFRNCSIDEFQCDDGGCISLDNFCDGILDCLDKSDEFIGCAEQKACGFRCLDGTCLDNSSICNGINDCSDHSDEMNCDGKVSIIYSSTSGIYLFDPEVAIMSRKIVESNDVRGVSVDADYIYWSRLNDDIMKIEHNPKHQSSKIAISGLEDPEDFAVDWLTGNIYFIQGILKYIGVCANMYRRTCTMIICSASGRPQSLALNPITGELFWSVSGSRAQIFTSGMDGKNQRAIISENLENPTSLTIDYLDEKLYWIDETKIESASFDGTDRKEILKVATDIESIAIWGEKLIWINSPQWEVKTIESATKDGQNRTILLRESSFIFGLHVNDPEIRNNVSNPCKTPELPACSQLCLLGLNRTSSCACTDGYELTADLRTCRPKSNKKKLVVASDDVYWNYYPKSHSSSRINQPNPVSRKFEKLVYNSITGSFLANSPNAPVIFDFDAKKPKARLIASTKSPVVNGMDFDYYGNNIYISRERAIDVLSLQTGELTTKEFEKNPHDILVLPELGTMYVVFESSLNFNIENLPMTLLGGRKTVVEGLVGPKISLARDGSEKVYYADEGTGSIGIIFTRSNETMNIRSDLKGIASLAAIDETIYWIRRGSDNLEWIDVRNPFLDVKSRQLIFTPKNVNLVVVGDRNKEKHNCRVGNGGCSHVCLVTKSTNGTLCACSEGSSKINASDNLTCSSIQKCSGCALTCAGN